MNRFVLVFIIGFSGIVLRAFAAEDKVDLAALEALTGRWIALRTQLAEEQQSWQRQQRHWEREISLLRREVTERRAALDTDSVFLSGVEEAQSDLQGETAALDASMQGLESVVSRHEAYLRVWLSRIPPGLAPELGAGFRMLPQNAAAASRTGVLRRLQAVLSLYTQIETLQNNLHLTRALLDVAGVQREVDILYFGLGHGFAVSASGDWAAVGTPSGDGWQWQEVRPEAARIRLAIRTVQRDAEAQLVPLLWSMPGGGRP
jgi:multidrug efflux pump subunit AcrA (membrane-fusion protein)